MLKWFPSFPTPYPKLGKSHCGIETTTNGGRSALGTKMEAPRRKSGSDVPMLKRSLSSGSILPRNSRYKHIKR